MNEQLQQALAAILNKTMAGVEAGASFLQAELPDVIQKLLMWKLVEASMITFAALSVIVFYALFVRAYCKAEEGGALKDYHNIPTFGGFAGLLGGSIACVAAIVGLVQYPLAAAQILVAPKIYLIEYAASLAK